MISLDESGLKLEKSIDVIKEVHKVCTESDDESFKILL